VVLQNVYLSVIVPAYNEAERLPKTLERFNEYRSAAGRIRLFTDADNSTDIAHFEKMKPFFDDGYDLVIASRSSRDAPKAEEIVSQGWHKRWQDGLAISLCSFSPFLGHGTPMRLQGFSRRGGRENFLGHEDRRLGI
jgi:hypothetical protein